MDKETGKNIDEPKKKTEKSEPVLEEEQKGKDNLDSKAAKKKAKKIKKQFLSGSFWRISAKVHRLS